VLRFSSGSSGRDPVTAHTPHQAPREWIARFKGKFSEGWDKLRQDTLAEQKRMGIVPANARLAALPPGVKPWRSLSVDERRLQARYMEVFAGTLAYQDAQFGRLYDEIERMGALGKTLVMFIQGDNGGTRGPARKAR
jgi:arylsulfatase A-like enzyme